LSEVKIGDIVIQGANVTRYIDMSSGLPLSMIRVSGEGPFFKELAEASNEHTLLEFECDSLKNPKVLVHGFSHNIVENTYSYTLLERGADVSCGYKLIHTKIDNELAIIVPEETDTLHVWKRLDELREWPFIRYILKKDIPEKWIQ